MPDDDRPAPRRLIELKEAMSLRLPRAKAGFARVLRRSSTGIDGIERRARRTVIRSARTSAGGALLRCIPPRRSPYFTTVLRLQVDDQLRPQVRTEFLDTWIERRPDDPLLRLLAAGHHARLGDHATADRQTAAAWLLFSRARTPLWAVSDGTLSTLSDEEVPNSTDEHGRPLDNALLSDVASKLLARGDRRVTDPVIRAALRRARADWAADLLADASEVAISPKLLVRLAEELHRRGEITRPLALLRRGDSQAADSVETARRQRERELRILRDGVPLVTPSMHRPGHCAVDALYLLHNSLPHQSGGYATRTHGLLTNLNAAGRRVVGVTRPGFPSDRGTFRQRLNVSPVDVIDNVRYERLIGPVTALPRTNLEGFIETYADMLQPIVDRHAPRLLHAASNWWNGHAANACARALGIPSIYEVRGLWEVTRSSREPEWASSEVYRLDARYEADAARQADHVIAITGGLRDELVRRGVEPEKITVVPNAVDTDRFRRRERDDSLASSLGLEGCCVLGFVGTFTFYEGLDDLLDAVAILRKLTATPVAVLFVGDGPERESLERRADELGLTGHCRFVGRVPHEEVERYLNLIDITPFPRKPLPVCEMVSPLKPLESMAASIPVVVSSVQALAEMVPGPECGLVVPKADVDALAAALAELADDPDRRHEMAKNAREWVTAERSWAVISERVSSLYRELGVQSS